MDAKQMCEVLEVFNKENEGHSIVAMAEDLTGVDSDALAHIFATAKASARLKIPIDDPLCEFGYILFFTGAYLAKRKVLQ